MRIYLLCLMLLSCNAWSFKVKIDFKHIPADFKILSIELDKPQGFNAIKAAKSNTCGVVIARSNKRILLKTTDMQNKRGNILENCLQGMIRTNYSAFQFTTRQHAPCFLSQMSSQMTGKRECFDPKYLTITGDNTVPIIQDVFLEVDIIQSVFKDEDEEIDIDAD